VERHDRHPDASIIKYIKSMPDDFKNVRENMNIIKNYIKNPKSFRFHDFTLNVSSLEEEFEY
jgi:hypothetical protein